MSSTTTPEIQLTIDGKAVSVPAGTTIFDAARINGIPIPTLCHQQNENPVGVCRVCVVDVGATCVRRILHSSSRSRNDGEDGDRPGACGAQHADRIADVGPPCAVRAAATLGDCELEHLAKMPESQSRAFRAAPHHEEKMIHRPLSRSTTSRASCATAAFVDATKSGTTGSWPRRARDIRPASPSTLISDGRVVLRFLRRMHGFVPDRALDQ